MTSISHNVQATVRTSLLLGILCAVFSLTAQAQAPGIGTSKNTFVATTPGYLGASKTQVTTGETVVLRGVNETGSEYECLQGDSVWDSSSLPDGNGDYQTVVNAMVNTWHANVVRIPLNEDCWLDEPTSDPPPAATSGTNYQTAIKNFVAAANAANLVAEVNLQVGGGPQLVKKNSGQIDNFPAMDTEYSLQFWQSVAAAFASNPAVIFNLTNEPEFLGSGSTAAADWTCYLEGGCSTTACANNDCEGPNGSGNTWEVQGVASVVTAIREIEQQNKGVTHVIIIAGLNFSNELDDWLEYVPANLSSMTNIAAGVHIYYDLGCEDAACWSQQEGNILANNYPVVIDETGELTKKNGGDGCSGASTPTMVAWANAPTDSQGTSEPPVGYWFWAFNDFSCSNGPGLLQTNSTPFAAAKGYGAAAFSALTSIQ